jgi:hypothetical protein
VREKPLALADHREASPLAAGSFLEASNAKTLWPLPLQTDMTRGTDAICTECSKPKNYPR